jgi:hypothetical protein
MTQNQKILIGVGAIALAYYFYTKREAIRLFKEELKRER